MVQYYVVLLQCFENVVFVVVEVWYGGGKVGVGQVGMFDGNVYQVGGVQRFFEYENVSGVEVEFVLEQFEYFCWYFIFYFELYC